MKNIHMRIRNRNMFFLNGRNKISDGSNQNWYIAQASFIDTRSLFCLEIKFLNTCFKKHLPEIFSFNKAPSVT